MTLSTEQPANKPSLHQEASRRVTELLRRTIVSQSIMSSALEIPKISDVIKERVFRDHFAGATGLRALLQEVTLVKPYDPVKDFNKIVEVLAEQTAVNGEMVIAAAVVVLSHSTADDVFTEACDL